MRHHKTAKRGSSSAKAIQSIKRLTSQSARAPVTELEGTAGVTDVSRGLNRDATLRQPVVTFGDVTLIEVT
jgi:hypothetical protein